MPMPKPVCRTKLYKQIVQLEVCRTFSGRGMGINGTAQITRRTGRPDRETPPSPIFEAEDRRTPPNIRYSTPKIEGPSHLRSSDPKIEEPLIYDLRSEDWVEDRHRPVALTTTAIAIISMIRITNMNMTIMVILVLLMMRVVLMILSAGRPTRWRS